MSELSKPMSELFNLKSLKKMLAIVGPTATGKSDLAVELARQFNGEIISADSRQVYKGMDLGSGKITKKEMRGIKHHLLDAISPAGRAIFSAGQFKKLADRAVIQIERRGRLPILTGGTGFWIDTVAFNRSYPEVPPNLRLRARLEKLPAEKLFAQLGALNPVRAAGIDAKNKRRLIRAIEIAKFLKGKNFEVTAAPTHQVLFLGLDLPAGALEKRIAKRLAKRLKAGMLKEAKRLHRRGVSWKKMESFGLEYKFMALHLQGKIPERKEMEFQILTASRQYAKRQRTWFKRNHQIHWLNAGDKKTALRQSIVLVKKFLRD